MCFVPFAFGFCVCDFQHEDFLENGAKCSAFRDFKRTCYANDIFLCVFVLFNSLVFVVCVYVFFPYC